MALLYDDSNTGIFFRMGKIIKVVNDMAAQGTTTLPAQLKAIADPFEAADMTDQIANAFNMFATMQGGVTANRRNVAALVDAILKDEVSVLRQLRLTTSDLNAVLVAIFNQMIIDSETIKRSTVTVGSVAAGDNNNGTGTILLTKVLDGVSRPTRRGQAISGYSGLNSELACTETMTFTCTRDSFRDGATDGTESFSWTGAIDHNSFDYHGEGSGDGPTLSAGDARNLVPNGNFESWTGDVPDSWTIGDGTPLITQETTTFFRGESALKLAPSGADTPLLTVNLPRLGARKAYCLSLYGQSDDTTGSITFTIPGVTTFTFAINTIDGSFKLASKFFVTPFDVTSDPTLTITTASNTAANVYIDDLRLNEVIFHGGIGAVVIPGATPFAADDFFTAPITQGDGGKIQKFLREKYQVQLPSSGTPTIDDALVS